jgi:undecaprenyl-diphosphatase
MASDLISALILAVVQGITEWFPISSSGHLVLFESLLGFSGGLEFEVALHFGTLMAVFVYFGREITDILRDFFSGKWKTENGRMAWFLIIGSLPAGIIGFLIKDMFEAFSGLRMVALGFGVTGLLLIIVSINNVRNKSDDRGYGKDDYDNNIKINNGRAKPGIGDQGRGIWNKEMSRLSIGKAFVVGIAQAFAIIPGVSRSGSTISTGVLLGLSEKNAMKFAFLLSIPVIIGANIIAIGNQTLPGELIWATLVAFVVGLLSIHVVFKYVLNNRKNFRWFGVYCLVLALGLGVWVFLR